MSTNNGWGQPSAIAVQRSIHEPAQTQPPRSALTGKVGNPGDASGTQVNISRDLLFESGGLAPGPGKDRLVSEHERNATAVPRQANVHRIPDEFEIPTKKRLSYLVDPRAVKMISAEMAEQSCLIPMRVTGKVLTVAMANTEDLVAVDDLRMASGLAVHPVAWPEEEIRKAIGFFYATNRNHVKINESWKDAGVKPADPEGSDQELKAEVLGDAPTIQFLNSVLSGAIEQGASDIHIEPAEGQSRIRFRLDGVLSEVNVVPRDVSTRLISRIKILSSLDIAEKRIPQDGRFFVRYKEKVVDMRTATLPTIYGESCAIRLLDQGKSNIRLDSLGFTDDQQELIVNALRKPNGLVLVTGPTGSGKSTTLCGMLNYVNSLEKKIVTLEDPVEYRLDIVNQICRNPVAGLTYTAGLRAILRNDPDIILVGEIRDKESASIAVQASLTGHLLLSTLHTTGAAETLVRLVDLGVEAFYVREVTELIVAQRLVRVLCEECKQPSSPPAELRETLGRYGGNLNFHRAVGCPACRGTGYQGRTAVFEVLPITERTRCALNSQTTPAEIRSLARQEGFTTLWEHALDKAMRGETSFEEIRMYAPEGVWRATAGRATLQSEIRSGETRPARETPQPSCSIHPASEITGTCAECGRPLSDYGVKTMSDGRSLCQQCAAAARMLCEATA